MANVTITVQQIVTSGNGLEPTRNSSLDIADTYKVRNSGLTFVYLKNTDASPHTFTIETPATQSGLALADLTVAVPAAEERFVGPFPRSTYSDGNNDINITVDDATGMELGAFSL